MASLSETLDLVSTSKLYRYLRPEPITDMDSSDGSKHSCRYSFGCSSMQGWRKQMEDASITMLEFANDPHAALFAVFDGHGGAEVARFAAEHVPSILRNSPGFAEGMYGEALRQTLLAVDEEILAGWPESLMNYAKSPERHALLSSLPRTAIGPGCAALACLLKKDKLHIANAGDCRAVLCSNGVAIPLSTEHRPESGDERLRIEQAGGQIHRGRINGRLSVSRGLGDFAYKSDPRIPAEAHIVTAYADIVTHDLDEKDDFLILASDGLWERRSPQEIIEFVSPRLESCRQTGQSISSVVEKLLEALISPAAEVTNARGCDNMTCIIVDLQHKCNEFWSDEDVHSCRHGALTDASESDPVLRSWQGLVVNLTGLFIVAVLGWIAGLSSGIAISAVGAGGLMLMVTGIWICILVFHRVSSTLELGELLIASAIWFLCACFWLAVAHIELSSLSKLGTFSLAGIIVSVVIHFLAGVYCREDTRKHSLLRAQFETVSPDFNVQSSALKNTWSEPFKGNKALQIFTHSLLRWWHDVVIARWWYDVVDWSVPVGKEEVSSQDSITVHNRTLKKVKVCIYASEDCLCWIPLGGVSGSLVRFVPAEQSCVFNLASCHGCDVPSFKLKVFKPSLLDIELACCPNVRCGNSFDFCDAEQMMKRTIAPRWNVRDVDGTDDPAFDVGLMSRSRSLSRNFNIPISLAHPERSPSVDEILLRNRSQQDIRALLFSTNDYVNWIPIIGKVSACGDCILPDCDRWFHLKNVNAREFTLKIYDVDSGAKEITYLTVKRGQTYIFSNSLLS